MSDSSKLKYKGHNSIATFLINRFDKRLDLEKWNHLGFTTLMKAAIYERIKIVQLLLSAGL